MNKFKRITSFKKRKVLLDQKTVETLTKFTEFVSHKQGQELSQSDILGTLLDDGIKIKKFDPPQKPAELLLNLPESAWENLQKICDEHGVNESEVVKKIITNLALDKGFSSFKKGSDLAPKKPKKSPVINA
jgi:hypothetical protein